MLYLNYHRPIMTYDGRWFAINGIIDDLRIYNRVLNQSEILTLYQWVE